MKIEIPETRTGKYQIEYLKFGETYEYCDEENIEQRVAELKADDDATLLGVHEVPPISPPGGYSG